MTEPGIADPACPSPAAIAEAVEQRLDQVRHFLASHLGGVVIDRIDDQGAVRLRFTGACAGCPSQPLTFAATVLPVLEGVDGVASVTTEGRISSYAQRRIAKYFGQPRKLAAVD
jgi:Fe-S cluster biogenesis protein NfuA